MRRHRLARSRKFEPVIRFANALGIKRRAPFGRFDQMTDGRRAFKSPNIGATSTKSWRATFSAVGGWSRKIG
jgi:hypothetical protein